MPVELHDALEQIREIRGHLATSETFRGYRAVSVAGTGLVAVAAAMAQPLVIADPAAEPLQFVGLWVAAAVLSAVVAGAEILYGYLRCASPHRRATTRIVIGHLLPEVVGGAAVTWALTLREPAPVDLLPGLWAMLVGLGLFASRRHLPRTIGWVALYYLVCGAAVLTMLPSAAALQPWVMGGVFGLGQIASAAVLYWNLERNVTHEEEVI